MPFVPFNLSIYLMRYSVPSLALILLLIGCTGAGSPEAATITAQQFREVHWILGKWRGSGEQEAPFFESYRRVDDSTIAQVTWSDEHFTTRTDSSFIRLRNGRVTNGTSIATEWSATTLHFEPDGSGGNSYTWKKESEDEWTAHLPISATHERVYIMKRVAE